MPFLLGLRRFYHYAFPFFLGKDRDRQHAINGKLIHPNRVVVIGNPIQLLLKLRERLIVHGRGLPTSSLDFFKAIAEKDFCHRSGGFFPARIENDGNKHTIEYGKEIVLSNHQLTAKLTYGAQIPMKRHVFSIFALLYSVVSLWGQEPQEPEGGRLAVPPAPVISGLSATVRGDDVLLSWDEEPPSILENVILRDQRPITAATYLSAERRGTIARGVRSFTDSIGPTGSYYYAILSIGTDGTAYDFFLPANNATLVGLSVAGNEPHAELSGFEPMVRDDAVIITWNNANRPSNLVLYRSTAPFSGIGSLAQALVLSSFQDTGGPYVDYPLPGVPYYYAVVGESQVRSGKVSFVEGVNTNRVPVEVPSGFAKFQKSAFPAVRPVPLPWLNPWKELSPQPWGFSKETERMIDALAKRETRPNKVDRDARVFLVDTVPAGSGEEFALAGIVSRHILTKDWNVGIRELGKFLAIRRTPAVQGRARFYLGQALFFSGRYREALMEFLVAQNHYPVQSREWVQYVLDRMVES